MFHTGVCEDTPVMIVALGGGMIAATDDKAIGVAVSRVKRIPELPEHDDAKADADYGHQSWTSRQNEYGECFHD